MRLRVARARRAGASSSAADAKHIKGGHYHGRTRAPPATTSLSRASNKQLNFVQHVLTSLKQRGAPPRRRLVLPDNCLFEGKAGEKSSGSSCRMPPVHTILRLPRGTFTHLQPGREGQCRLLQKGRPHHRDLDLRVPAPKSPGITKKKTAPPQPARPTSPRIRGVHTGPTPTVAALRTERERFRRFPPRAKSRTRLQTRYQLDTKTTPSTTPTTSPKPQDLQPPKPSPNSKPSSMNQSAKSSPLVEKQETVEV